MHRSTEAAVGPGMPRARGAPGARVLRVALAAAGVAALLGALALCAGALAALQVPQHRAALEALVRAETGLDLRFGELGLRWGWYGPEAVFRRVEVGEPGAGGVQLGAPELVAGFDVLRMLRSGALEVGRITLVEPDIDLARAASAPTRLASAASEPPERALQRGLQLLARWRGTRIDIVGGTLRTAGTESAPVTLAIQHASLRRTGSDWNIEARARLPPGLGARARVLLAFRCDPRSPQSLSGTLELHGERLELAGWRTLLADLPAARWLPTGGSGTFSLEARFAADGLSSAEGAVQAESLTWPAASPETPGLALEHLRGLWHLVRSDGHWRLTVSRLELPGSSAATLALDVAPGGAVARGTAERLPVAVLAGLARSFGSAPGLEALELGGTVREASCDFDAGRAAGARLRTRAELAGLTLGARGGALRIAGLTAHVAGDGRQLEAELRSGDARLELAGGAPFVLPNVEVGAHLELALRGAGWRLTGRGLELRHGAARLLAAGTLTEAGKGTAPDLDAHASLSGADVALVRRLLGAQGLAALGGAAQQLTAGSVDDARLRVRGRLDAPLPWSGAGRLFAGSLALHAGVLEASGDQPPIHGIEARLDWRGARVHARIASAAAGSFRLAAARADFDARAAELTRFAGRIRGEAGEALEWLRAHPQLARTAPGIAGIDLRGQVLLDLDLQRAGADSAAPAASPRFATRVSAQLEGVRLEPVAGLPPVDALHGTLAFADGHLQRSMLSGSWLGGPVTLSLGERLRPGTLELAISARGQLGVRQALLAATDASGADSPLQGSAEWSAELRFVPSPAARGPDWRVHAESTLVGVASRLPEPFAKSGQAPLPVHLDLAGSADAGLLRLGLGNRLQALVALRRRGELWQIERGALAFGATAPVLPQDPVMRVQGTLARLDLPGYLLLWRQLAGNPAWPALHAELRAATLLAAGRVWREVGVWADAGTAEEQLRLESGELAGWVRWPHGAVSGQPVAVHLARLDVPPADGADASGGGAASAVGAAGPEVGAGAGEAFGGLLASLVPLARVSIDDLEWQGRALGAFSARIAAHSGALDASELLLAGPGGVARGALHCQASLCRAQFSLDSRDAAAALASLGFRTDLAAARAQVQGELAWPPRSGGGAAPGGVLASATGSLHIQMLDGAARGAEAPGTPLGLLAVPGLLAGTRSPELRFSRLSADFALGGGQAVTSDLHLDGDSELLLRGRIGLLAHDYDARVWVLKGEERLPEAVRSLAMAPRVAALWLSLRELFAAPGRGPAVLRLRGTWDDPMVSAVE
jgi:uncharacterized protein YhdP